MARGRPLMDAGDRKPRRLGQGATVTAAASEVDAGGDHDIRSFVGQHGAEVDPANVFGNTPLFVAVFNSRGRGDVIALLRERGANPFRANSSGQTPVGLARLIGNYNVADFFSDLPA